MRIAVAILAFDNWKRVLETMCRFDRETDTMGLNITKHVFYVPYPLPSPSENFSQITEACRTSDWDMSIMNNDGQDGNIKKMVECLKDVADIFVPYDTDVRPRHISWLKDSIKVFEADAQVAAVSMNCKITDDTLSRQVNDHSISGIRLRDMVWHGGFPIVIMRMSWIAVHGYKQYHNFYGGTEYAILESIRDHGLRAVMMSDHDDARWLEMQDQEYHKWKHHAINKAQALSFEDWLKLPVDNRPS